MHAPNIYDGRALKAFVEQDMPRWWALLEQLYEARDPRWLGLAERERRFWVAIIALEQQLRRLTVTVWSIVAMLQADDPTHQALGTKLLADLVGFPFLTKEKWDLLKRRASESRMGFTAREYLQRVVMPQALLLVCANLHIPQRLQLGPHGQGRMLDAERHWTPQAPVERLSFLMLSFYIVKEVPKAAMTILVDTSYHRSTNDAWEGHVSLSEKFEYRLLRHESRLPEPGPLLVPSPETLAIQRQEKARRLLALERLVQQAPAQQKDILFGLSLGLTPAQIARALGVSRQTVNKQIARLRQKGQLLMTRCTEGMS